MSVSAYIAHHNSSNSIKLENRLLVLVVGEENVVGVLQHHIIHQDDDKMKRFP